MTKYPKAFEKWWSSTHSFIGLFSDPHEARDIYNNIKHIAFGAWKAGRAHQKKRGR